MNPANPFVLDPHLRCAAHELPLTHADERWWPGAARRRRAAPRAGRRAGGAAPRPAPRADRGVGRHRAGRATASGCATRPARRCASSPREGERPVGDVDRARAPEQVHAGASYLHQGQHWRVVELDLDVGVARVEPDDGATYTVPRRDTEVRLLDAERAAAGRAPRACTSARSRCTPRWSATSARTRSPARWSTRAPLDLPARPRCVTRAVWYVVDAGTSSSAPGLDRAALPGRAARHRARRHRHAAAVRDLRSLGRRRRVHRVPGRHRAAHDRDLRRHARAAPAWPSSATRRPTATCRPPARASRRARATTAARRASSRPKCGNGNDHLDKRAALDLLAAILDCSRRPSARPLVAHRRG